MIKQYKIDEVADLVGRLKTKKNIILTNYSGIKVKDLSDLRKNLRGVNAEYKVVKNTLFMRALKEAGYENVDNYMTGPVAVAFTDKDLSDVAKILRDFKKEQEKFEFGIGVMDNVVYNSEQVKNIADLPSKEVLISKIMYLVNAPTSQIAMGMNQIMASLARGIKAVAEKNA